MNNVLKPGIVQRKFQLKECDILANASRLHGYKIWILK